MKIYNVKRSSINTKKYSRGASYRFSGRSGRPTAFVYAKKSFIKWVDENNSFYFQIIGILILTAGLIVSFGGLSAGKSNSVSAYASDSTNQVHVYSNFRNVVRNPESTGQVLPLEIIFTEEITESSEAVPEIVYDFYRVKRGDTLYAICQKLDINCDEVKEINDLEHPYALSLGQEIQFPAKKK